MSRLCEVIESSNDPETILRHRPGCNLEPGVAVARCVLRHQFAPARSDDLREHRGTGATQYEVSGRQAHPAQQAVNQPEDGLLCGRRVRQIGIPQLTPVVCLQREVDKRQDHLARARDVTLRHLQIDVVVHLSGENE